MERGGIGQRHIKGYLHSGRAEISIVEPLDEHRNKAVRLHDIANNFSSLEETDLKGFDLAVVCAPAHTHVPLMNACAGADLPFMVEKVDIVSVHTPHTRETYNLLNRERLQMMKRDAFLVNVSRRELIDEEALVELIKNGHLSGAGLDVFDHHNGTSPDLLKLARQNRVVLTPHMASSTLEGRSEMGETVILNIRSFVDNHQPPHRVLP